MDGLQAAIIRAYEACTKDPSQNHALKCYLDSCNAVCTIETGPIRGECTLPVEIYGFGF